MNDSKCDLCGVDDAVPDGLLCPSCREAIARLLVIDTAEQPEIIDVGGATISTVDHPEKSRNTRKAGS